MVNALFSSQQLDVWTMPYFGTRYANGRYIQDGGAIFSAINKTKTNILKINLVTEEYGLEIDTFTTYFMDVEMLVITVCVTERNKVQLANMVKEYIENTKQV